MLQLTHSDCEWLAFQPPPAASPAAAAAGNAQTEAEAAAAVAGPSGRLVEGLVADTARLIKRRAYLVERARGANIIGILVRWMGVRVKLYLSCSVFGV